MWKLLFAVLIGSSAVTNANAEATPTLAEFRKSREDSLKKNWLVVTGLNWLKTGVNTLGSDPKSDIDLPASVPANFAKVTFAQKKATITFETARSGKDVATFNGKPVQGGTKYDFIPDTQPNKSLVTIGTVEFHLIDRPNGFGIRVKDSNADTLKNFKGLNWYPEQKNFIIQGQWKEIKPAKTLMIPDILGNSNEEKISGSVVFQIDGQSMELFPTRDGEDLFFVFKDTTAGKDTYGTGRFLYAKVDKSGKVVMDFNRAYNPPCAFIKYATCPLPPAENKLKVAIAAGEKNPPGATH